MEFTNTQERFRSCSIPLLQADERNMSEEKGQQDGLGRMRLPFVYKLHLLLNDMELKGCNHIISWVGDGKAFKIHDPEEFEKIIQPHYFRQSKLASFIRQVRLEKLLNALIDEGWLLIVPVLSSVLCLRVCED
jgi:HSF-type DNA-binding